MNCLIVGNLLHRQPPKIPLKFERMRAPALSILLWLALACGLRGLDVPAGWAKLEGCEYREGSHSDGDSVEVVHEGKPYVFRVYFVDCIEKNPRSEKRRRSQGLYFGMTSEAEALRYAHAAADATRELLEGKPFRVWTRWEMVTPGSDNPSIRAFVETAEGRDLATELVSRGLAIIRGGQALADHPMGRSRSEILKELRELETQARVQGLGAWASARAVREVGKRESVVGVGREAWRPGNVLSPMQEDALMAAVGQEARVRGRLSVVSSLPDNRITFLNFAGVPRRGFVTIVRGAYLGALEKALGGPLPDVLSGREVEIRGKVSLYRNSPQIELEKPTQIRVLDR